MIPVLFISSGLGVGGAEVVLMNLLRELDRSRFTPHVVSLTGPGEIGRRIADLGVPVLDLDFRRHPLRDFARLVQHVRHVRPGVVQTWMYHGDLIGALAARLGGARHIAWSLHNLQLHSGSRGTRLVRRVSALLSSRLPEVILSCSEAAGRLHVALGYDGGRLRVIANGFDTMRFRPDPAARAAMRSELGVPSDAPLVLNLGRHDPMKNQAGFIRAAALLRQQRPDARFVMAGLGIEADNAALNAVVNATKLGSALQLLGPHQNTPQLLAACDLLVQSSISEAFPMVLGEAMSCGVPCVATDVGDSRLLVGDTGFIVPPLDEPALAEAMAHALAMPPSEREALGRRARQRIVEHYDIRLITRRYEAVYLDLARNSACAA